MNAAVLWARWHFKQCTGSSCRYWRRVYLGSRGSAMEPEPDELIINIAPCLTAFLALLINAPFLFHFLHKVAPDSSFSLLDLLHWDYCCSICALSCNAVRCSPVELLEQLWFLPKCSITNILYVLCYIHICFPNCTNSLSFIFSQQPYKTCWLQLIIFRLNQIGIHPNIALCFICARTISCNLHSSQHGRLRLCEQHQSLLQPLLVSWLHSVPEGLPADGSWYSAATKSTLQF